MRLVMCLPAAVFSLINDNVKCGLFCSQILSGQRQLDLFLLKLI